MRISRQAWLAGLLSVLLLAPFHALSSDSYDLDASLSDRAKWKSFGVKDWTSFNPLERALPSQKTVSLSDWSFPGGLERVDQLKALIAFAEAGPRGYNAVHTSARVPPPRRPTEMTLGQIRAWVRATPGQPHAIGRYQFIPSTLANLKRRAGMSDDTRFTPAVQDRLADYLLADAGYQKFLSGRISRTTFMNNLARIWAGLPLNTGKSAYHGYAGNRATVTIAFYRREMKRIFGS